MNSGRPPSWNPFAALDPGAWTEVVPVSSKDRLTLPTAVRRRLAWFEAAVGGGLVAILDPQGRAEMAPWSVRGEQALADVSQRMEAAPPEARGDIAIAAMDRYMRVAVEPPARLALAANLAAHLDPDGRGAIRVVVRSDRLWLSSEQQWQARRMDRIAQFMSTD